MIWDVLAVRMDVIAIQHTSVRSGLYMHPNNVTELLMSRPCRCCSLSMFPNHGPAPTAIPNCIEGVMTLFGIKTSSIIHMFWTPRLMQQYKRNYVKARFVSRLTASRKCWKRERFEKT